MLLMISMVGEITGRFYEKELQKTNQKEFRLEKAIKRKGNKLYVQWKDYNNSFNSWIDKKRFSIIFSYKMSQYFPEPYEPFGADINIKVDLSNYATKAGIKNISYFYTSIFALKTNLATLKTEDDKLDLDKLVPVPVDFSKLSDVVKNNVFKNDVYDKLVTKVNSIDTSGLF